MIKFRTQYHNWGRVLAKVTGEHKTIQSVAAQHDLNVIVKRLRDGLDPGVPIKQMRFGESLTPEMREFSMQSVAKARSAFEDLSPEEKGDTKSFAEYLESKLTREGGTVNPLDVTVPTDSKSVSSKTSKKGSSSEKKGTKQPASEENIQKGDESPPQE